MKCDYLVLGSTYYQRKDGTYNATLYAIRYDVFQTSELDVTGRLGIPPSGMACRFSALSPFVGTNTFPCVCTLDTVPIPVVGKFNDVSQSEEVREIIPHAATLGKCKSLLSDFISGAITTAAKKSDTPLPAVKAS